MPEGPGLMAPFQASSSLAVSPFAGPVSAGRQRFYVELKEETNVVSWKKLLKNAPLPPAIDAPPGANPALEARLAPETALVSKEPRSAPNRFSNVIEKIERLYQGQESDDEHLDNGPDDDQYNTDDSFIDDKELDEYFSVEKAKTKHDGFFINKGKLEKINEPSPPPAILPKKRKRKEIKSSDAQKSSQAFQKRYKADVKAQMERLARPLPRSVSPSAVEAPVNVGECLVNKQAETQPQHAAGKDGSLYQAGPLHKSAKSLSKQDNAKRQLGISDHSMKSTSILKAKGLMKNAGKSSRPKGFIQDRSTTSEVEKPRNLQGNIAGTSLSKKSLIGSPNRLKLTKQLDIGERKDSARLLLTHTSVSGKDESPHKRTNGPKGTILERAIQDLKLGVAELCPSNPDIQEQEQAPNAAVKAKRLPREIKQKIAKIARLAAKQGKIPDELIDRLMSILGHLMQLKTLKRNLKEMVEMGLAAKHEKEGRLLHMKREFTEMVRSKVCFMQEKGEEGSFDDFQAVPGSSDKNSFGGQYKWDQTTEDRVCDLYDQCLEGTDESKGPQSRKLYVELAELWPEGWMDKDGIKNAVYRAKERKKALHKLTLNESKKKNSDRIDLYDRLAEGLTPTINLPISNRLLPSNTVQTGKPAVVRKQTHRGLEKPNVLKDNDKKRYLAGKLDNAKEHSVEEAAETESEKLVLLKFRKQKHKDLPSERNESADQVFDDAGDGLLLSRRPLEPVLVDQVDPAWPEREFV